MSSTDTKKNMGGPFSPFLNGRDAIPYTDETPFFNAIDHTNLELGKVEHRNHSLQND